MVNFIYLSIAKRRFPTFGDKIGKKSYHEDVIMERIAAANPHAPLSSGLTMVYMYYSPHLALLPLHAVQL
jgi:hypothetical protein